LMTVARYLLFCFLTQEACFCCMFKRKPKSSRIFTTVVNDGFSSPEFKPRFGAARTLSGAGLNQGVLSMSHKPVGRKESL
jgi:hypothetical protein